MLVSSEITVIYNKMLPLNRKLGYYRGCLQKEDYETVLIDFSRCQMYLKGELNGIYKRLASVHHIIIEHHFTVQ